MSIESDPQTFAQWLIAALGLGGGAAKYVTHETRIKRLEIDRIADLAKIDKSTNDIAEMKGTLDSVKENVEAIRDHLLGEQAMNLQQARIAFTRSLGRLIQFGVDQGYDLLIDEVKRHPVVAQWNATHCRVLVEGGRRCEKPPGAHPAVGHAFKPVGISKSVHLFGLAADVYVMKNGLISNEREPYATMAQHWKHLHWAARWGGDFEGFADLGHFSFEWEGRE